MLSYTQFWILKYFNLASIGLQSFSNHEFDTQFSATKLQNQALKLTKVDFLAITLIHLKSLMQKFHEFDIHVKNLKMFRDTHVMLILSKLRTESNVQHFLLIGPNVQHILLNGASVQIRCTLDPS